MCHVELLRFWRFLGAALSRCSIFCRPGFGLGLGRSGLLRRSLGGARRFVVVRRGVLGRGPGDFAGLLLRGRGVGGFLRTCSSGLVRARLGRGFGLGRSLLRFSLGFARDMLVIADRDDLQDRVLLAMALLAAVVVPAAL